MIFVAVAISFFLTVLLLPAVIRFFKSINLLDSPERRKVHKSSTPAMGGLAIFFAMSVAVLFSLPFQELAANKFIYGGMLITFLLGFRDDISSLQAKQKLAIQSLAGFLVVNYTEIAISGFYGVFGINQIPHLMSVILTIFVIVALSNSFNLIDGIDGLAGAVALISSIFFALWFLYTGNLFFSIITISLASAIAGFLLFNWHPSRVFMGDTGSIFIGFLLAVLAIQFINENSQLILTDKFHFPAFVSLAIAILIVPIYDTTRVFMIRIFAGGSPFVPDKKHIHHILLKQGFNHSQSTLILIGFNITMIILALSLQSAGNLVILVSLVLCSTAFGMFFDLRLLRVLKSERRKARDRREMYVSRSA